MATGRAALFSACVCFSLATLLASAVHAAPSSGTSVAPLSSAHTLAQTRHDNVVHTLLVLTHEKDKITAIDLSALSGHYSDDAFDVIKHFDAASLDRLAAKNGRVETIALARLAGIGPRGVQHIAAGTNYRDHGKEVGVDDAFLFPKIAAASGPRSTIVAARKGLLDYEVEVCARFDREIRSLVDFDEARKGFFLCGDFTDRATLLRNVNLKDIRSGDGFADAKTGPNRFPVGPFLAVPKDWRAFLGSVSIETYVNGDRRQHAMAGAMIKDLRVIVEETLEAANVRTWSYGGHRIPIVARGVIGTESAILTGTGDGVVFKEPGPEVMKEVMTAKDRSDQLKIINKYIDKLATDRTYLQPGDSVRYSSNFLGAINVSVTSEIRNKNGPSALP